MESYVGTSGFSFAEWKGHFYPLGTKQSEMLPFYAARLPAVELNSTFYRMPRLSVLEAWAARTPPQFRFALKASRRITHFKKLVDCEDLVSYLFGGLSALGERLGPVLFQLPPTCRVDLGILQSFLQRLPPRDVAFEFRHPSWFEEAVYEALADRGAALVGGDGESDRATPPFLETAPFAYLRLRHERYEQPELNRWAERIASLRVQRVFVFFKHETTGPELARAMMNELASMLPSTS